MNVNTKELANQAGFHFDEYNEATARKVELLVELVVKRCCFIATHPQLEGEQSYYAYYGVKFDGALRRHFGVFNDKQT